MTSINMEPQIDVETNAIINGIQTLSRKKQTAFEIPLEWENCTDAVNTFVIEDTCNSILLEYKPVLERV